MKKYIFVIFSIMLSFSNSVFSQDSGLHIVSSFPHFPIDLQSDTLNSAIITFNETIVFDPDNGGTFTVDDVAIKGPNSNDIIATAIIFQGNNSYKITFPEQTKRGIYTIKICPNISDNDGNLMDQDQDGILGELEDDVYVLQIKIYDLISLNKPVTANGSYTPTNEVASNLTDGLIETKWSSGTSSTSWAEIDLEQSMIIHEVMWYGHAVPTGTQTIKLYIDSELILEQDIIVSYTTPVEFTLNSPVKGRYVKIEISGGTSWKCGFECEIYGYDLDLHIINPNSDFKVNNFDYVSITFNKTIVFDPDNGGTFTVDDVVIKDPFDSDIVPTVIISQGNNSYKITFPAQTERGIYIIKIGPNISDNYGNLMDQDQDGILGELEDDVYILQIKIYDLISLNKPVTANGSYTPTNEVASNLTDGLLETKWSSGTSSTSWAEIDLEQSMIIHEVMWYGHAVPTGTQTIKLYIDSELILEQNVLVSYTTPVEFTLNSPVKGRYVKIEISGGTSWKCGFECEIYGYDLEQSILWDSSEGGNDHYYELIELQDSIIWNEAKSIAETMGGHLATITTQQEQDWIVNTFGENIRRGWLGAYQDHDSPDYNEPNGGWKWVTNEVWNYTNWRGGEPNNSNGGIPEDFIEFWTTGYLGSWNDVPSDYYSTKYLIEFPNISNQLISNVQVQQRMDGSKIVDITYDLSDCDGNILNIDSYVSIDNGVNWIKLLPEFVSGDIGAEVVAGENKYIVWHSVFNIPFGYYENCKIRIVANYYYGGRKISNNFVIDNLIAKSGEGTDLNGDGYQDIVMSNYYDGDNFNLNSCIYWGTEYGYKSTLKTELTTCGALANSIADLNGDGYLDIVFSNYYSATRNINSYIYWGDESASYNVKTELATHGARGSSIADLNGDGYLDIVFSNHCNDVTYDLNSYIYWGDEFASYSVKTELATHGATANSIADLNNDGYLDIVFSNYYNDSTNDINSYIYWGDDSTPYSTKSELSTHGARGNSIADLNGDGYLDIVFSNYKNDDNYNTNSYIYWGDEFASYSLKTEVTTHGARGNSVADLNNDGYLDLVFSNYYNGSTNNINSYIYWGDESASYSSKTELPTQGGEGVSVGNMSAYGQNYILGVDFENQPAQVSNVSAHQREDGTGVVDIYYDVFDNDGDNVYVSIELSNDGGVNWTILDETYMTGEVGAGISSGTNKHIEWNPTVAIPFAYNENYNIKVIAHYLVRGYGISNVFSIFNIDPQRDTDNDGMPDVWEIQYGLNPQYEFDSEFDNDNDGLINLDEYIYGTNPFDSDTDNDGLIDGSEIKIVSSEFKIFTQLNQDHLNELSLSIASNGKTYFVIWQNLSEDRIYGQLLDNKGNIIVSAFRISTLSDFQFVPSATSNGTNYFVTWVSYSQDLWEVYGRFYNNEGVPIGSEFQVNTYTPDAQYYSSVTSDGSNYLVTWTSNGQDGSDHGVYGQFFDNEGSFLGSEFQVNTYTTDAQDYPSVTSNGKSYLVTWRSYGQDGSDHGVYGQFFDNEGVAIGIEFQINTYTYSYQHHVSASSNGVNYFVTWHSKYQDGSGYGVYGRFFDNESDIIGTEFQINTYSTDHQVLQSVSSNGRNYFVTWQSQYQDGSGYGVYGQFFDNEGSFLGSEFQINTYSTGDQDFPSVTSDGINYFVAWQRDPDNMDMESIYGALIYAANPLNFGTDPLNPDTDNDGIIDGDEVFIGTNPNDSEDFLIPLIVTQSPTEPDGENLWFISQPVINLDVALTNHPTIYYKIDDNGWLEYSESLYIPDGEHELYFYAQFKPDKPSDTQTLNFKVDLDNPTIAISKNPSIPDGENSWYTVIPEITLSFSDTLSSPVGYYRIDDGVWSVYSSPILINGGQHELSFYAQDEAGRNSDAETVLIKVDLDDPTISASILPSDPDGSSDWYITSPEIALNASDSCSSVTILYMIDNDGSWIEYTSPIYIQDGEHGIFFYAKDESGKISNSETYYFKTDSFIPQISVNLDGVSGKKGWFVSDVIASIEYICGLSGVNLSEYSVNGNEWQPFYISEQISYDNEGVFLLDIRVESLAGQMANSTTTIMIDKTPPPPITNLVADGNSTGTNVILSWSDFNEQIPGDVEYYLIYTDNESFTQIDLQQAEAIIPAGNFHYTVENLIKNTNYYFAVVVMDDKGNAIDSVTPITAVPLDITAPDNITDIEFQCFDDKLIISWNHSVNTFGYLAGYKVYFDNDSQGIILPSYQNSYEKTGLQPASAYPVKISAFDNDGNENSGYSSLGITLLPNPGNISIDPQNGYVDMNWGNIEQSNLLKHYLIYVSVTDFQNVEGMTPSVVTTGTSASVAGLINDATYYFAVTTVNLSNGEQKDVSTISGVPVPDMEGPVVSNIKWDNVTLTNNHVLRKPSEFTLNSSDPVGVNSVEFYIDGEPLHIDRNGSNSYSCYWNIVYEEDDNYVLTVIAYDTLGNSTIVEYNIIVDLNPPSAPIITTPSNGTITNNSVINVSGTTEKYTEVFIYNNDISLWNFVAGENQQFSVSISLSEGFNSIKAVARYRENKYSGFSDDKTVTLDSTIPFPPNNLEAQSKSQGTITLNWRATGEPDIKGYNVYRSQEFFSSTASAVKINSSPINNLYINDLPTSDSIWYYRVSSVDNANNESSLSDEVFCELDRILPEITSVEYTPHGVYDPQTGRMASGLVNLIITVSEPLQSVPFFSITPNGGFPVAVDLNKLSDLQYEGFFVISENAPSGTAYAVFSGRDISGNRGTVINVGNSIEIDTQGPSIIDLQLNPNQPIKNDVSSPVVLNIEFKLNETVKESTVPNISYLLSGVGRVEISVNNLEYISTQGNTQVWSASCTLPADAGLDQFETFSFNLDCTDDLENIGSNILCANVFEVYQDDLPPLDIPIGLNGVSMPEAKIKLTWIAVNGAVGYQLYRMGPDESEFSEYLRTGSIIEYIDEPSNDGTYFYKIASIREANAQESLSDKSNPIQVISDSVAPDPPLNLELELVGNGIKAQWNEPSYTEQVTYSIYRSNTAEILSVEGLTPLAKGITQTLVVDPYPSSSDHCYAVTAVDNAGNESVPSKSAYLNFELLPVSTLNVIQNENDYPVISWTHTSVNISGYNIYLNISNQSYKLNDQLIDNLSYIDTGYLSNNRQYTVIAIDEFGVESPGRSIFLPQISAYLEENSIIKRNLMNRLLFQVVNNSQQDISNVYLKISIENINHVSEKFQIDSGNSLEIPVIVGGYSDLPDFLNLTSTVEINPNEGEKIEIIRSEEIGAEPGMLSLSIQNEEFVKGLPGVVKFSLQNTSEEEIEIITATGSGNSSSNEITFYLMDNDGNILSSKPFQQSLGSNVVTLSDGKTVARIVPGEVFISDPIEILVPSSAPDKSIIQLAISKVHYHLGKPEHVVINGLNSNRQISLVETGYTGNILEITPETSKGDQDIIISGYAIDRSNGLYLPEVPLDLIITVNGYERRYNVITDNSGMFSYAFKPLQGESGIYKVCAVHPDLLDRPEQSQFIIKKVNISPQNINLNIPRNYEQNINIKLKTADATTLNNAMLVYDANDQPEGEFHEGVNIQIGSPVATILPNRSASLNIKIWADNSASSANNIVLKVKSDDLDNDSWGNITLNCNFSDSQPFLYFSPNYIETGLGQNDIETETLVLENKGLADLRDVTLSIVNQDGSPAPQWIYLNADSNQGSIAVGEKRNINITFNPDVAVNEGMYHYYLKINSSNYSETKVNLYITVTQSGTGNVLFKLSDIYTATLDKNGQVIQGLAGARIHIQNEIVTNIEAVKTTDSFGEALFEGLPTGTYKYRITANNHQESIGRLWIKPGVTTSQSIFLEYNLVTVEWEVVQTTVEDKYEIVLNATYETNVPAPVVVAEPSSVNLPDMNPGDVYNGEFTLTNYGLITAENLQFKLPESDQFFKYELLEGLPNTLSAKERITVPYKVTCLSSLDQEDGTGSGGGCHSYGACLIIYYYFICINGDTFTSKVRFCVYKLFGDCGGSGGVTDYVYKVWGPSWNTPNGDDKPSPRTLVVGSICWPYRVRYEILFIKDFKESNLRDNLKKIVHPVACSVNTVLREFNDEDTDLSLKVPGGNISIERLFYADTWYWEHLRNNLTFNLNSLGDDIESINKGGVIYNKVSDGVYAQDYYRINRDNDGYIWKDKNGNWKKFDSLGRMLSYGDRINTIAKLIYENDNSTKLLGITDQNDRQVIWYEYDENDQISSVHDISGRYVNYTYENNLLKTITDVNGNETTYFYNASNQIIRKVDAAGRPTIISYDSYGNVESVIDNDGNGHFFQYDYNEATMEQYARITYSSGRIEEMWYDKTGHTKRYDVNGRNIFKVAKDGRNLIVTDEKGNITYKYLDEWMNITKIVYPDGTNVSFAYEHIYNNLIRVTDAKGIITKYDYDNDGNLIKLTEAFGTDCEKITTYSYDEFGQLITVTSEAENESDHAVITVSYDEFGNIAVIEDAMGNTTIFLEYDNMGNLLTMEDSRHNTWYYEYDNMGRLIYQTDPLENTTSYEYDGANNNTAIVNAYLKKYMFEYDDHNNMIKAIDPYNNFIENEYNTDDLLTKITDQEGKQTQLIYDNEKRLIKSIDGAGNEITYHYDESKETYVLSDKPVRIDYLTYSQKFYYNRMQRLVKKEDILDNETTYSQYFAFDASGNLISQTDAENNVTRYEYDPLNRLVKTIDPLGGITEKIFDKRGNMIAVKDPNNGMTSFKYDLNSQVTEKTRPMGQKTFYEYDNTGNIIQIIDSKGQKIGYEYNEINRLVKVKYFTASDYQNPVKTVDFEYDKLGDLISYDDGVTFAVYTYDDLQRKISETVNYGTFDLSYTYAYFKNGLKKSFTGPDESIISYTYDDNNRLETISIPGSGQVTYNTYQWNNPSKISLPGGTTKEYTYDPLMRLKSIIVKDPAQNALINYTYTYSPAGNIIQKITNHGTYNYQYDDLFRLISADNPVNSDETYTYDLMGNRLTSANTTGLWQYNQNNQLTIFDNDSFEYDNNGNMTQRTIDYESTKYNYNIENRITIIQDSNDNIIAEYYYDPFGRRLWKDVDSTRIYFFYSDEGLIGEYDSSGNEIKTYGYEPGSLWMTNPLYQKIDSTCYWYHNDHLGTPLKMTDSTGHIVWAVTYDSFGNIQLNTEEIENNLRFPGQYYDSETGLYYNLNRYYDPLLGRYLRVDPFGEGLNLYDYVTGNPLSAIDPQGLCKIKDFLTDVADMLNPVKIAHNIRDTFKCTYGALMGDIDKVSYFLEPFFDPRYILEVGKLMGTKELINLQGETGTDIKLTDEYQSLTRKYQFVSYGASGVSACLPVVTHTVLTSLGYVMTAVTIGETIDSYYYAYVLYNRKYRNEKAPTFWDKIISEYDFYIRIWKGILVR